MTTTLQLDNAELLHNMIVTHAISESRMIMTCDEALSEHTASVVLVKVAMHPCRNPHGEDPNKALSSGSDV